METAVRSIERQTLLLAHEASATAAAWAAALDTAVARLAPWLVPQQRHYLVGGIAVFTALVGAISTLFLWIASRQVRPRKLPPASTRAQLPTSPTSKRKRHSRSFTDLEALERDRIEENAILDRQDRFVFPRSLRDKCRPEDLKLIYDTLSKVFSFLKGEFVEPLANDLRIHRFARGDEIFARGKHDGAILLVVAGEATLTIHSDSSGAQFSKPVRRGETFVSSLALLVALICDAQQQRPSSPSSPRDSAHRHMRKVCGNLSAAAATDGTTVFQIPTRTIARVVQAHPESFFRLAQTAFSQVEKITAKSLMHHFGLYAKIIAPTPLIEPHILKESVSVKEQCVAVIAEAIGLHDRELRAALGACVKIVSHQARDVVNSATSSGASSATAGVFIVVDGEVTVQVQTQQSTFVDMYIATRGCEIGIAACFVGSHAVTRAVCGDSAVRLLWIPDAIFSSLLQVHAVAVSVARHLVEQYAQLVCVADSSFDWLHLHGGESLFHRGDACSSVFTVISGRLRAVQTHYHRGKEVETTSELGRGATLGAMDMLAAGRSNSSVFAIRDSQIAQMSRNVFDYVVCESPTVLVHFTTNLAQHLTSRRMDAAHADAASGLRERGNYLLSLSLAAEASRERQESHALPLGTVAVLSLTKTTKIETFCAHLLLSLRTLATTESVSSQKARTFLGEHWIANSRVARANLSTWLGDIEGSHDLVIYEADAQLTPWTRLCIRQADHILLLCSDAHPQHTFLNEIAATLQAAWEQKSAAISVVRIREADWTLAAIDEAARLAASDASKTNVLKKKLRLARQSAILPRFLLPMEKYEWISGFHNVQVPFADHAPDFLRLCRRITGNAVGIVLGGGGARGLAHIGVLRALDECGVHVDVVGGTSIGAFIGAVYALHPHDLSRVGATIHSLSRSLSSVTEKLRDLTLPISSFFSGSRFNSSIRAHFYDLAIEDLMLNYFCVSTDIAKSRMNVHHTGLVWKSVRASMTLQGYLPPISEDGSVLLDGGYMNNLPADVMKDEGGIKYIVAVDVGSEPRRDYFSYGSSLSGWWLLWNKINPFAKTVSVPSMGDVSAALAYVSSEQHKDRMKAECIDLYLRPPVNDYGTLQFDKMDEIIDVGYRYALPRIRAWANQVLASEPDADIVEPSAKAARREPPLTKTVS